MRIADRSLACATILIGLPSVVGPHEARAVETPLLPHPSAPAPASPRPVAEKPSAPSPKAAEAAPPADAQPSLDDIYRQVFGKARPPIAAGDYTVLIDGTNVGEYRITPADGSQDGSVDAALIRQGLLPLALPGLAARLRPLLDSGPAISFAALRATGVDVVFDSEQLALRIALPTGQRVPQNLSLRAIRHQSDIEAVRQADFSAYASLRAGVAWVEDSRLVGTGFDRLTADLKLAANVAGVVAEADIRYDESRTRRWSRGDIRLTYDDRERMLRYEIGDLSIGRRSFQIAPRIAGVSAYRQYAINPYRNIRPVPEQLFELTRPARVEILLNGASIRTFNLRSGRYSLRDFPLIPAAGNDIELRITYATGETEVLLFPAFFDLELLAPGLVDFAINLGLPYRDENGVRRYDDGTYNGTGYIRFGVSPTLTLGANWEGDRHFDLIGGEAVWATALGTFGLNAATNVRAPRLSGSQLTLQYRWRDADRQRDRSIDASLQLTGKDYRTLNQLFSGNFIAKQARFRIGQNVSPVGRLQFQAGYDRLRSVERDSYYAGVSYSHQFRFGSLSVGVDYRHDSRNDGPILRAALTIPLGRGAVTSTYSSDGNAIRSEYSRLADVGAGTFGYSAGAERRDGADMQYGRMTYSGNRFVASVEQVARDYFSGTGRSDLRTQFSFGSAIVMADGQFGIGRPITNSFALVSTDPRAGSYRLAVEPRTGFGSTRTRYSAYSGALGPAVVPTLSPYFNRSLQVDAPDAPAGSSVGGQVFTLTPGYRSGYRLVVGNERNASAVGLLTDRNGTPIAFAIAQIAAEDGSPLPEPAQLFTNASGRFFVEGLEAGKSYRLTLSLNGRETSGTLSIPAGTTGLYRLAEPIALPVDIQPTKER